VVAHAKGDAQTTKISEAVRSSALMGTPASISSPQKSITAAALRVCEFQRVAAGVAILVVDFPFCMRKAATLARVALGM
jgi:Ribonuclease G/E